jgi:hypothetical protein
LFAVVALAATACGSSSVPANDPDYGSLTLPPPAGEALIVPETVQGQILPGAPTSGLPGRQTLAVDPGACTASSGDVYLNNFLDRLDYTVQVAFLKGAHSVKRWSDLAGGTISAIPEHSPDISTNEQAASNHLSLAGLVCRADGTLATSYGQTVYTIDENPKAASRTGPSSSVMVPLAGNGTIRGAAAPVASTMPAASALTVHTAPIGERQDGSLVIIDGPVVWSLHGGMLRRIYQWPGKVTEDTRTPLGLIGAVTADDTAYIAPEASPGVSHLGDVIGIRTDGTTTSFGLPDNLSGQIAQLKSLDVYALVSDGGDGLYVRAGQGVDGQQYVLHIRQGHAEVIAASAGLPHPGFTRRPGDAGKPVNALSLPVFLPVTMAVQGSALVLSDDLSFGIVYVRLV